MAAALVIRNHGVVGRIRSHERRVAVRPPAARLQPLHRGPGRKERGGAREHRGRERAQRRDVVDDPNAAAVRGDHEIVVARMDREIAHRHRGQVPTLVARPLLAAVERHPQPELGAEEQQVLVDEIFLDHVGVAAHRAVGRDERRPRRPVVGRLVGVGPHVAEGVEVERRVDRARVEMPRLDRRDPRVLRQARDVGDDVGPRLAAVFRHLQVAVVRPRPDDVAVLRRLGDREDRGVRLGGRVVHRDAARLLLLLLQRVVGGQVG